MEIGMKVIRVRKNDLSIINEILTHHIEHSDKRVETPSLSHLEELMNDDRTYLFAALSSDMVTGNALAYRFPSLYASEYLAYLYDIEVGVKNRRQGIGRVLVETLLAHLKADGVREVWLGTAVDNVEGQALFHATGALKSGETFNDYTYYLV
jgi:L-amino acid N-acyltransferase YncA